MGLIHGCLKLLISWGGCLEPVPTGNYRQGKAKGDEAVADSEHVILSSILLSLMIPLLSW
jgi:hypothetical protein